MLTKQPNTTAIVVLPAEELLDLIGQEVDKATSPLRQQLEAVERKLAEPRLRYTSSEIAAMLGVKTRTVRQWIISGKTDSRGRTHLLGASELKRGQYSLSLEAVNTFIKHFE